MKSFVYAILVFALVSVAACTSEAPETSEVPVPGDESTEDVIVEEDGGGVTVEITNSGFVPRVVNINAGEAVTFVNNDGPARWPASNAHPIHTNYPADYSGGSYRSSRACEGEGQTKAGAFDACKLLDQGESYSFTFDEAGTWAYHDHLSPTSGGVIIVG